MVVPALVLQAAVAVQLVVALLVEEDAQEVVVRQHVQAEEQEMLNQVVEAVAYCLADGLSASLLVDPGLKVAPKEAASKGNLPHPNFLFGLPTTWRQVGRLYPAIGYFHFLLGCEPLLLQTLPAPERRPGIAAHLSLDQVACPSH